MIVITGKLDELFVRWSTQTFASSSSFARWLRSVFTSQWPLKQETKTKLKVLLNKGDFISEGTFALVSSSKQFAKSISSTIFNLAEFRSFGTSFWRWDKIEHTFWYLANFIPCYSFFFLVMMCTAFLKALWTKRNPTNWLKGPLRRNLLEIIKHLFLCPNLGSDRCTQNI